MKSHLCLILALGWLASSGLAQDRPDLMNPRQKTCYALGMNIAAKLKQQGVDIDMQALAAGMADMQAGNPALTPEELKATMKEMQMDIKARRDAQRKIDAVKNLKLGQDFLAANASKEGVKVIQVTAPDGSPAEVQYQVLKSGAGPMPGKTDILKLNYEGSLIDGTVFDSSKQRGTPFIGRANDFIAGWNEPLQMMKVGDRWRLFIPPSLGYGEYVPYNIGPNSTLIYDIELLSIEHPADGSPAAPAK
jgi:FKBP-type peptidyl-prolyl cis-trans isomerase FklB